jgi:hypothetical protein
VFAAALVALVVGGLIAGPGFGQAASESAPVNSATPTVTGTPQENATLTAQEGTWTGDPTSYAYVWGRCDANGDNCTAIAGAAAKTYVVQSADVGSTIRVTVTATNADGSGSATSAPTAVIASTAPAGCPSGTGAIQIADLAPPARLSIAKWSVSPTVVTRATGTIQLHFGVTACGGRPVQGAAVFATPIPYSQFSVVQGTTSAAGIVTLAASQLSGFPADRRQELLAVLIRASKPGEPLTASVSTRRVVSFPVSLHG